MKSYFHKTGTRAAVFFSPTRMRSQGRQVWAEPRSEFRRPSSLALCSWPWAAGPRGGRIGGSGLRTDRRTTGVRHPSGWLLLGAGSQQGATCCDLRSQSLELQCYFLGGLHPASDPPELTGFLTCCHEPEGSKPLLGLIESG